MGCGRQVQAPERPEPGSLTYEIGTLERLEPGCSDAETCARVSLEYPEITAAPSQAALGHK